MDKFISWFIRKDKIRGRTNLGMARVFVFTHLFGPVIAQPMAIYLYFVAPEGHHAMYIMVAAILSFWALPFILRATGNMTGSALLSFQGLAGAALFGTYWYGGFSSPFLPWLIVSLLLGFFYLYKRPFLVLVLFFADIALFMFVSRNGFPNIVEIADLRILGLLSIVAAVIYMSWMALYYARMIAMRSELTEEAKRYHETMNDLQKARVHAEDVSQSRAKFFSKMSHELRTPLNAIIGYSEILLEDCSYEKKGSDQLLTDLKRINAAGKHLLSLVSDVLDTENMENEELTLDVSQFTVGELCDEVVASGLPMIERNRNRLVIDSPTPEEIVVTDGRKLRQMLINLLSNAAKFTENGTVTLKITVDNGTADDRLRLSVTDTGIGIAPEAQAQLFEAYMQADVSISKRFGGTGIGLAITRKFAMLLGGNVTLKSVVGQGSTFTIDIPSNLATPKNLGSHEPKINKDHAKIVDVAA